MTPLEKEVARLELALSAHTEAFNDACLEANLTEHRNKEACFVSVREALVCDDIRHVLARIRAAKMARVRER